MGSKKITRRAHRGLDKVGEQKIIETYMVERNVDRMLFKIKPIAGNVSNAIFYQWLHKTPERWENWQAGKKMLADLLVEDAYDVAWHHDPDEVQSARLKASINQWMAERYNRQAYGRNDNSGASVTLTFSDQFLEALKQSDGRRRIERAERADTVPEAEFEVVDESA